MGVTSLVAPQIKTSKPQILPKNSLRPALGAQEK